MSTAHLAYRIAHEERLVRRGLADRLYWPETMSKPQLETLKPDLDEYSHPDLEDDALISWGLKQAEGSVGANTTIDVLYGEGPRLRKCDKQTKPW
jgi:hypothetical protein